MFDLLVGVVAITAGAIASVAGFGIGSLLTPLLALHVETKVAVAAVSLPHLVGTAVRFWPLRHQVDRQVLWTFGLTSAAGGLIGALLHTWSSNAWLSRVFGGLLLFVAVSEFTGLARRMHFHGPLAWTAGGLSGLLGGMVGNQGGIRSAALLGFRLSKASFVATATAIGLFVDAARMPVYLVAERVEVLRILPTAAVATAGVVAGTLLGQRALSATPEPIFRRLVAVTLAALGLYMLLDAVRP